MIAHPPQRWTAVAALALCACACGKPAARGAGAATASAGQAPTAAGVCWRVTHQGATQHLGVLSRGDPNLETCAMHLEVSRRMHGWAAITGAYQGEYIYADRADMLASPSLSVAGYSVFTKAERAELESQITTLIQATSQAAPQAATTRAQ